MHLVFVAYAPITLSEKFICLQREFVDSYSEKDFDLDLRGAVVSVEHFDQFVSQYLSGAGSSPAGSVGRDLNLQKLHYQYLSTSVAVLLVVR